MPAAEPRVPHDSNEREQSLPRGDASAVKLDGLYDETIATVPFYCADGWLYLFIAALIA